jgi:hypothetical protein
LIDGGEKRTSVIQVAIELVFDNSITLARGFFQLPAVQDLYAAPHITDGPYVLKVTRSHRNPFAAHAEHVGDQFLSHDQLIRIHTVMA